MPPVQAGVCEVAALLASLGESDAAAASSVGLAGMKTTKPIPAGLSFLSSQHASDHTMACGFFSRPYSKVRGRRRGLFDTGSTSRSRRNLRASTVTLSRVSWRPIARPARWIGCVAALPNRLVHQDRLNWSWPASLRGPADPAKDLFSMMEPSERPSFSTRDSLTPAYESLSRSNGVKSCWTRGKGSRTPGQRSCDVLRGVCPRTVLRPVRRGRAAAADLPLRTSAPGHKNRRHTTCSRRRGGG